MLYKKTMNLTSNLLVEENAIIIESNVTFHYYMFRVDVPNPFIHTCVLTYVVLVWCLKTGVLASQSMHLLLCP